MPLATSSCRIFIEFSTVLGRGTAVTKVAGLSLRGACGWIRHGKLLEDGIHDSGRQKNLPVRNRRRSIFENRDVELLNEVFHARLRMEIAGKEQTNVMSQVARVLTRKGHRRNELFGVTGVPLAMK